MAAPYIPAKDSLFASWLDNFATLIAASPSTYGLTAGEAATISAQNVAFQAAYATAINPSTRTPSSVAAKDASRAGAEATVRPFAILIRNNAGVTNEEKSDLGLTIPDLTPTPVPPPATAPVLALLFATPLAHQLQFRDSTSPLLKRKPVGVVGLELWRAIGTVAATDPAQSAFFANVTKTPFISSFESGQIGKHCTYFARWTTRSGPQGIAQVGPWSAGLDVIVI